MPVQFKIFFVTILFVLFIVITQCVAAGKYPKKTDFRIESYQINGVKQYISVCDSRAPEGSPVILFLHGGPGSANLSLIKTRLPQLDKNAIVVNWDQRGAGKTFRLFESKKKLNIQQFISDTHELIQILKQKYKVDQIILMGFSWGSALGLLVSHHYPEDIKCFISIAQFVSGKEGEQISLDYVKSEAQKRNDMKAIKKLQKIKYDFTNCKELYDNTMKQRKYLLKYGGIYQTRTSYQHEASSIWNSPAYSFIDFLLWPLGSARSLKTMWCSVVHLDFFKQVPQLNVPVVFICGRFDMNNPVSLTEEYFNFFNAPKGKELIIIDGSAHSIFWDKLEELENKIVEIVNRF